MKHSTSHFSRLAVPATVFVLLTASLAFGQQSTTAPTQLPDDPASVSLASLDQTPPTGQQQSATPQQETPPREPVGTAAAEAPSTAGISASEPAGAAIAPAKQRRARIFLIKMGAIVGAGAAIGAVAALSAGSPSRPPGTH